MIPSLLTVWWVALAAGTGSPAMPVAVADTLWVPLVETSDVELQDKLRAALESRPPWRDLIRKRKLAVGIVDLTDASEPRFAQVNGDEMMYAASLAKLAILLAAHVALDRGDLTLTEELDKDLHDMIRVSSNPAAARLTERLGLEAIEAAVTDPRFRLFDPAHGGGLWMGKAYGRKGRRRGDPMENLSHAANVTQVCRFFYLLSTGRVISRERSRLMLEYLVDPGLHHKFVHSLDETAPEAEVYRKSGTFKRWHSDAVLVWGPRWRRYILVAMVESPRGEQLLRNLLPVAEDVLRARTPDEDPE